MKRYWVYILKCSNQQYYVGVTNNIDRRIQEHKEGINSTCWTYNKRPIQLKYVEIFNDINLAIQREKQLKKWRRAKKEALIENNSRNLIQLSKRKEEYSKGEE